jgi:2-keto-3-deoxy-L-fuconate dehydrogenase
MTGESGDFSGLVAIVTGGASGIGAATAATLVDRGARVAVLDLDVSAALDQGAPDALLLIRCDVTSAADVDSAVTSVAETLGGIDIVVNNAGIGAAGDVTANSDDEWHHVLDVNVVGIARVSRAAMPYLRRSARAAIVNTSSVVATVGVVQRALYAASKGAVAALTLAMAADHVGDGIRINAVTPGTADTPWVARLLDQAPDAAAAAAALRARQPMGRLVTATEVAHAIAYLASPMAGSTTGTILAVDGGMAGLRIVR